MLLFRDTKAKHFVHYCYTFFICHFWTKSGLLTKAKIWPKWSCVKSIPDGNVDVGDLEELGHVEENADDGHGNLVPDTKMHITH
jgi:hypothetical protein